MSPSVKQTVTSITKPEAALIMTEVIIAFGRVSDDRHSGFDPDGEHDHGSSNGIAPVVVFCTRSRPYKRTVTASETITAFNGIFQPGFT
jgi:hypothetical protein